MTHYCSKCGRGYDSEEGPTCPKDGQALSAIADGEDRLMGRLIQGRFRLVGVLGRGGAGVVYRAVQLPIGREVAVKVVTDTIGQNDNTHDRFFREAQLASTLRHPNIVSPVDFGEDSDHGVLFFAMEYIAGIDLRDLLDGHRLTVPMALEIIYQTCGALTDAHDKGIIHRDLKPRNLRLVAVSDGSIQVKVLDLGIARPMDGQENITQTGNITGTIAYLPPEYVVDGRLCGPSDLYSLGIMLFEMLVGHKPFGGNHLQVMFHHIKTPPPSINDVLPDGEEVPADVEELYLRLVQKVPEDRYPDARAVRVRIDEIRKELGYSAIEVSDTTEDTSVETFRKWLLEAASAPDFEMSLPTDILSRLKGAAEEITAAEPKKKSILPTPAGRPDLKRLKAKKSGLNLPRPGSTKSPLANLKSRSQKADKKPGLPSLPPEVPVAEEEGIEELSEEMLEEISEEISEEIPEEIPEVSAGVDVETDDALESLLDDVDEQVGEIAEIEEIEFLESMEGERAGGGKNPAIYAVGGVALIVILIIGLGLVRSDDGSIEDQSLTSANEEVADGQDQAADGEVDEEVDEFDFALDESDEVDEVGESDELAEEVTEFEESEESEELAASAVEEAAAEPSSSRTSRRNSTRSPSTRPTPEPEPDDEGEVDIFDQLLDRAGTP